MELGSMLTPRTYQIRVLETAIERNTLAFLPTGT
jgi:ERCC4-related helicase